MSHFCTTVSGHDAIKTEYWPANTTVSTIEVPAAVHITLGSPSGYLHLSIEHARELLEALPGVLAEHDQAVASDRSTSGAEAA